MPQVYSIKQVEEHNTLESLWVIFNDRVYDITEFAKDHPGGDDILLKYAGKDITKVMSDIDMHDHSQAAFDMLEDYLIGVVEESVLENTTARRLTGQRASLHRRRVELLSKEVEYKTYTNENFSPSLTDARLDIKTHQFLDLNKPLVPQMMTMKFTREHYLEQVHKPRYLNRPADFFGHPLLEPLSKTVWWVVPTVWLPYVGYNIYNSLNLGSIEATVLFFTLGVCIWTLLEYLLHRFLFHYDDRMPENQWMFLLHFTLHGFHHYLPMDRLRLVVPPALLVVLAYPWIMLAHMLFPSPMAFGVVAGGMFGYVCYDLTHYYLHHARVISFHFSEMKKYHLAHHYKDFEAGYGITSKLWDYVFKTVLTY
ncbi:fatty acid alpha-hydroxylase [Rhizopus stolonifer]|uniref:Ceramide very long chain fatty acid hydroxylase n=1 Tax=Rhizopus stolonifer TaxID=4846 RepID=A0A367KX30_RHIST|nr:fatty acid alpha-hydroxylase [Rhizopus stolonifer]